jgi:hypothetical protein
MRRSQKFALFGIAVIVTASSAASFAESYRALLDWASRHQLPQFWAWIWPLQIDAFIAVGELALFVALARAWGVRSRVAAWVVTLTGLAVSVAANVGHVTGAGFTDRLTAAVPPIAAAASLTVGLVILKWLTRDRDAAEYQPRHAAELATLPSDARRVVYAAEITGSRDVRELTAWLHDHGQDVALENVRTALRRAPLALTSVNGNGRNHDVRAS